MEPDLIDVPRNPGSAGHRIRLVVATEGISGGVVGE